ncbi:hybrid sensor histidine kinase/response regulator [Roseococcus sp. SDR]|uniref:hybrid sensor histidine kinase/response regulator n=1 Tax=Roseococcus sp. SDR TaxID=2835532 RepID=UPI001BCA82DF|nr:hybrid sensor histidine kinase/response regulator [Roseococcus sp. SDR]MBS7789738.1 hybrid sensor histidine kinase/response regulator [Roseococcus sp. SDR]MBV1845052.1 hybrid sensor histidine kinase/response regulator [Roseococcus sp. SDR]
MPQASFPSATPARILVVDDEDAITDLLARYLSQAGADVVQACDTWEAERMVTADPSICVVISDIAMPGRNGLLLAEALQSGRPDSTALEVIIMTGYATTEAAIAAMRARAFDLLRKPLRLAEMTNVVSRAVESSLARRARAARETEIRERVRLADEERRRLARQLQETQSGLRETRCALESIERMRAGMLSVISHELRTPLIPVMGFSEFIATSPDLPAEELREYAMHIHKAGGEMVKLIDVALDIVALQDGLGLGQRSGAWVTALVERVFQALAEVAQGRGVSLLADGASDVPVYGDIDRIERALLQVTDNAIKASPPGAAVTVQWRTQSPASTHIEVLDRGSGVSDAVRSALGSVFLKAEAGHDRAWPGAGLGLALVQRVVSAHGGTFRLKNLQGGGGAAVLVFPHHEVPALRSD